MKIKNKDGKEETIEEGVDSVRAGVTLPYSPEFAELETNAPLLEKLREITGGRSYADDDATLAKVAAQGEVFRSAGLSAASLQPVWHWLVLLAAVLLFFDVAVRRIAVDVETVREFGLAVVGAAARLPLSAGQAGGAGSFAEPQGPGEARARRRRGASRRRANTVRRLPPGGRNWSGAASPAARRRSRNRPRRRTPESPPSDGLESAARSRSGGRAESDKDKPV